MDELIELAGGLRFPEGPVAEADGSVLVVEIARGTLTRIRPDGSTEVVAEVGPGPNGAAVGPDGRIWVCDNGGFVWHTYGDLLVPGEQPEEYRSGSIRAVDLTTGAVEVVHTTVGDHSLRGPNDLVFDGQGGYWFTDHGKTRARDRDRGGLYYAEVGGDVREVVYPMDAPNGVGLSPDGGTLYVAETHQGRVLSFDLEGPGRLAGDPPADRATPRCLATLDELQLVDSLAVTAGGSVCVATLRSGGITVVPPDGGPSRFVATGDPLTTNICFGGPDLRQAWITGGATGRLWTTTWDEPGLRLAHT